MRSLLQYCLRGLAAMALLLIINLPQPTYAANSIISALSDPCAECGNCTIEDGLQIAVNAFNIGLGLVGALVLLMVVYGGFMMVISHGNTQILDHGKQIITQTLIGFALFLLAWTIVNGIITGLSETVGVKDWFKIKPSAADFPCEYNQSAAAVIVQPSDVANLNNTTVNLAADLDKAQLTHVSPSLANMIQCIQQQDPTLAKDMVITSISDNGITKGYCKINECNITSKKNNNCGKCSRKDQTGCVHACGSCHYGFGTEGSQNFSTAIDVRLNVNEVTLKNAVDACSKQQGTTHYFLKEGDHYHISDGSCPHN